MTNEEDIMKENISFEELETSFMSLVTKFFHPGGICQGLYFSKRHIMSQKGCEVMKVIAGMALSLDVNYHYNSPYLKSKKKITFKVLDKKNLHK